MDIKSLKNICIKEGRYDPDEKDSFFLTDEEFKELTKRNWIGPVLFGGTLTMIVISIILYITL